MADPIDGTPVTRTALIDDGSEGAEPVLVLTHDGGTREVKLLADDPKVLGRSWPADIVVPDRSLSKKHARFAWTEGAVMVEDCGSRNGTWVDGDRIEGVAVLGVHSALSAGETIVRVRYRTDPAPTNALISYERWMDEVRAELARARVFGSDAWIAMVAPALGSLAERTPMLLDAMGELDRAGGYAGDHALVWIAAGNARDVHRRAEAFADAGFRVGLVRSSDHGTHLDAVVAAARSHLRRADADQPVVRFSAEPEGAADAPVAFAESTKRAFADAEKVGPSTISVLILGETGTGKELVARAIHRASKRAGRLVSVNCAALAPALVESTLFGHDKGAFTGAESLKRGLFEEADGGTLFLDEVGELTPAAQASLLRALQEGRIKRVGATEEIAVDVRIVAATHRPLASEASGFRRDLFYRLNGVAIELPSLRDRREDIAPLARRFFERACAESGRALELSEAAVDRLVAHDWPGNVRQLRNVIERAVILADGSELLATDLPPDLVSPKPDGGPLDEDAPVNLRDRVKRYERDLIVEALRRTDGNTKRAAHLLELPVRTLTYRIKALGITKEPPAR